MRTALILIVVFIFSTGYADAASNRVQITTSGEHRIIKSNGLPDHPTGRFPNSGNPNYIREQDHVFRVPLQPRQSGSITPVGHNYFGVALNGVPFDPGTAEYHNNDRSSGWNYEALSGKIDLGIDRNNAHVQPDGSYHYHGLPGRGARSTGTELIGYAADGFPIYAFTDVRSSYRVKSGRRPSGPGGYFDGTFVNDYHYTRGAGDLDECNGMTRKTTEYPAGTYLYILTDSYPYVPRCWKGYPDRSFFKAGPERSGGRMQQMMQRQRGSDRPQSLGREVPQEAIDACRSRKAGSACRIKTPRGIINGTCVGQGNRVACRPEGGPPGR